MAAMVTTKRATKNRKDLHTPYEKGVIQYTCPFKCSLQIIYVSHTLYDKGKGIQFSLVSTESLTRPSSLHHL